MFPNLGFTLLWVLFCLFLLNILTFPSPKGLPQTEEVPHDKIMWLMRTFLPKISHNFCASLPTCGNSVKIWTQIPRFVLTLISSNQYTKIYSLHYSYLFIGLKIKSAFFPAPQHYSGSSHTVSLLCDTQIFFRIANFSHSVNTSVFHFSRPWSLCLFALT